MSEWAQALIPYFKAVHIAGLLVWCGGLFSLPLMLSRHDAGNNREDYVRIRRATHLTYTIGVTPAAVIAIVAGTWLIFLREALVPWLYAKLFFVALLVGAHAWIGHVVVTVAETRERGRPPAPYLPLMVVLVPMLAILTLVLGKPDLSGMEFPGWMTEPRGGQLPFEVPR